MDISHVFPQGLLAALTSSGVRMEMELPPYQGGVLSQVAGAQDLRVAPKVTLFPLSFSLSFSPLPALGSLFQREGASKEAGGVELCQLSTWISRRQRSELTPLHPLLCSDVAPSPNSLCPSQPTSPHSFCLSYGVVEPHCRAGGAHIAPRCVSGCELWRSSCPQRTGLLLMCCVSKSMSRPGSAPGPGHLCVPLVESLSWLVIPYPELHSCGAEVFSWFWLGHGSRRLWETSQPVVKFSLPFQLCLGQVSAHASHGRVQASHSLPVSPSGPPTSPEPPSPPN